MSALTLLLLIVSGSAEAKLDLTRIPATVCPTWQAVTNAARTCAHNDYFLKATRSCLAKIESLEQAAALPTQAIANAAEGKQSADLGSARASYAYTDEALGYLLKVARVGYAQVEEYQLYVLPPSDDEGPPSFSDYSWMSQTECYGGNRKKLAALQAEFAAKIARLEARRAQARQYENTLAGSGSDMGSLQQGAAAAGGAPAATGFHGKDYRPSDVTGTEDLRKKKP